MATKKGSILLSIAKLAGGIAGGVLLNDVYEMGKGPGYFQDAFALGSVNVGVDDLIQTAVSGGVALVPGVMEVGIGAVIGTWAVKFAEMSGMKLQIIPHEVLPP